MESIARATQCAGIDRLWCLGDFASGGPDPVEVYQYVMESGQVEIVLGGNHEYFVINQAWRYADKHWARSAHFAADQLGAERIARLAALPAEIAPTQLPLVAVHGALTDPTHDFLGSQSEAALNMQLLRQPLLLFGHTHRPACWVETATLPRACSTTIGQKMEWTTAGKLLLNPGAGCDRTGARWLELIVDDARWQTTWHQTDIGGHGGAFSARP
jgi:predicted phosphodiesterase